MEQKGRVGVAYVQTIIYYIIWYFEFLSVILSFYVQNQFIQGKHLPFLVIIILTNLKEVERIDKKMFLIEN